MSLIYKICSAVVWQEARQAGSLRASADDARDGFIHFSTAAQLPETLSKHFAGRDDLVLLTVAEDAVRPHLRWEPARGGALFPHLYGALSVRAVQGAQAIGLGADGRHVLPELAP